jgi:hypothetical protein
MGSVLIFFASSNGTNTIDCCDSLNQLLQVIAFPTGNDTMMRFFEPNLTLFFTSNFVRFALYGFFGSQVSSQANHVVNYDV